MGRAAIKTASQEMLQCLGIAWWAEAGRREVCLTVTTATQGDTSGFKVQIRAVLFH